MLWIEIALPGVLLLTKFLLKLVVDRSATLPDLVSAVLALPVDIVFLSASLLAGYAISSTTNVKHGLPLFIACLCLSLLIVLVWRRSEEQFTRDKYWSTAILGLMNIVISGTTLVYSLSLLSAGASE